MNAAHATAWLDITRDDFLSAIKRLKPGRMLKSYQSKELQIGFLDGEAVFCIEGAQTRRPSQGEWKGFACVPFGLVLPFLKVPPMTDTVRLSFEDGRLRIGTVRYTAKWIEVSPWISQMALEAHFMAPADTQDKPRYCPRCGKRQGVLLDHLQQKSALKEPEKKLLTRHQDSEATHACRSCLHGWKELD